MLRTSIHNKDDSVIESILNNESFIKSRNFYPGFDEWFRNRFMPEYQTGVRDIISVRCKKYQTLLGFSLIKYGEESKICNLSPMVDGVGITQAMLDSALFYLEGEFTIDVPLLSDTERLSDKLIHLGFDKLEVGLSNDNTMQQTYIKHLNLKWI